MNRESENHMSYPKEEYPLPIQELCTQMNGATSFRPMQQFQSDTWSARIYRSSGGTLEKATCSFLHITKGTINGSPGSISRFEAVAYPENPKIPALFIMTDMTETEEMGSYIVFYSDLIIQDRQSHQREKNLFASVAQGVCDQHGHSFKDYNEFIGGRGTFGGNAGECGLMGFFQEKDIPFLEALMRKVVPAYAEILELNENEHPQDEDHENMYASRARFVEWMIADSLGTKIMRENNIPLHILEVSSFPPVVKY
jgi:coproporphyrinogen III oxidase